MKRISVLITDYVLIAAVGNARYLFNRVNEFLIRSGKPPLFEVKLIGKRRVVALNNGPYTIQTDATIAETEKTDLIIIPPLSGDMEEAIATNKEAINWLCAQHEKGAEIASLCVGAFLLAETGLLNDRSCSTHWVTANDFRDRFPQVILVDEKIITDQDGLYTSGGANSYWNLLIYLTEKFAGKAAAIYASKYFEIDRSRDNQSLFRIFEGSKIHGDENIQKAQAYIEENYAEKFTVEQLAKLTYLSPRTFQRRFKEATHYPVHTYIQKVRIEVAKRLLETQKSTVNDIMYEAGYQDPKAFRAIFKKETGVSPLVYREKYM